MNPQTNNGPEMPRDSQASAPAALSATQLFYWSVRRELWEYRSLYLVPLVVAAIALFGFLIATIGRAMAISDLAARRAVLEGPFDFVTGVILGSAFLVGIFYTLDSLQGERRDRSILFWKSLPVSDTMTVLSKVSIPLVIVPLLSFAITAVAQLLMLTLSSVVLLGSGLGVATLWKASMLQMAHLLFHLVTAHMIWYAPLYSWMVLISAWARRMAFVWAALPLLVIAGLEKIIFNTKHFLEMLDYRLSGPSAFHPADSSMGAMGHVSLGSFLTTPGLWTGLVFAALCLAGAVRLRRYREPI